MDEHESLSHTKWDCKYHVVFIPKRRRTTLYSELRRHLGEVFRQLAGQKESRIVEGHLMPDPAALSGSHPKAPGSAGDTYQRDDFSPNRHLALFYCWSMIFSENRYPLFGIML